MVVMRQGSALFRAKWTAKEIYLHTRAFGLVAGVRYAAERVYQVRARQEIPHSAATIAPPPLLDTLVVIGAGAPVSVDDSLALRTLRVGGQATDVVALARAVVFRGRMPLRHVRPLLRQCRHYDVTTVYVYGPGPHGRAHSRLLSGADIAVYNRDPHRGTDLTGPLRAALG